MGSKTILVIDEYAQKVKDDIFRRLGAIKNPSLQQVEKLVREATDSPLSLFCSKIVGELKKK